MHIVCFVTTGPLERGKETEKFANSAMQDSIDTFRQAGMVERSAKWQATVHDVFAVRRSAAGQQQQQHHAARH